MAKVYGWVPVGVARMAGNDSEMDVVANKLATLARGRATAHVLTGAYISQIYVKNVPGKKGVRDRMVYAGDKAAMSIEYGHAVSGNRKGKNDHEFTWVPGQYIMTGAIAAIPGYSYNSFGRIG